MFARFILGHSQLIVTLTLAKGEGGYLYLAIREELLLRFFSWKRQQLFQVLPQTGERRQLFPQIHVAIVLKVQ